MNFRTVVEVGKPPFQIPPFERLLFVGSCFADRIGQRFQEEKFRAVVNPYGVMYNPASILHTVEKFLPACDTPPRVAFLTLGTSHVYVLNETGEIVDNCQKKPQALFTEKVLTVDECAQYLKKAVQLLQQACHEVQVVVTVSPIRYAKYGFHGSNLSKAALLMAAEQLCEALPDRVTYFPAYEIVCDELRDYRFYQPDMLHPSEQAVDYIWQRFCEAYLSKEAKAFMKEWLPVKEALGHRPFHPESEEYLAFQQRTQDKVKALKVKYPDMP